MIFVFTTSDMKALFVCFSALFFLHYVNGRPRSFIIEACERMPTLPACQQQSANSVSSSSAQAQAAEPQPSPISKQMKDYCFKNNAAYQQFCQQGLPVPKFAYEFCIYYYQNCPGANPPGSGNPPTTTTPVPPPTTAPPTQAPAATTASPKGKKKGSSPPKGGSPKGGSPKGGGGSPPAGGGGAPPAGGGVAPPAGGGLPPAGGVGAMNGQPLAGLGAQPPMNQFGGNVPGGLGVGQSINSPFFGSSQGTNVVPTKGVVSGTAINAAGIGVGQSQGVDFSGLPFLSGVNQALGVPGGGMPGLGSPGGFGGFGRRRRRRRHNLLQQYSRTVL